MAESTGSTLSGERLELLYQISQTFNASLDLDQVLACVMDEVISATGAERGFVMLRAEDGSLVFQSARGMEHTTIDEPQFEISRSVVEEVARTGKALLTSDAQADTRLQQRQSIVGLKLRSILCAPLKLKDRVLGVIYVDNRLQSGIFKPADLDLLAAIASSAAIAIENARLYQVAIEKGRMERELQMARKVQSGLIPQEVPQRKGWEFAASWMPAHEVAGDFYDFPKITDDKVALAIADVVDKGMAAALFMTFSRSLLRASADRASSPLDAVVEANKLICADSAYGMFLTLLYAEIDTTNGQVTYVNAGHNPPVWLKTKKGDMQMLLRTGMLVGVFEEAEYEQAGIRMEPGDFLIIYTDGLTEAVNSKNEEYGVERMRKTILENRKGGAAEMLGAMEKDLQKFVAQAPQFDDVTILVVKRV